MRTGEREIEAAEAAVQQERDAGIARMRAALLADGEVDCIECGEEISAARKKALPSSVRCIGCQGKYERELRGH